MNCINKNLSNNQEGDNSSVLESSNLDQALPNDLYPERTGEVQKSWFQKLFNFGNNDSAKLRCEKNVYWCVQNSPLIKIMVAALNASGCKFDLERHVACEYCDSTVSGGFDANYNQVVICQNVAVKKSTVQAVMVHELTHMFDYCQNELDFNNIHHVACSEIRAANLANCSFLSSWYYGTSSPFNIKGTHKDCVKQKALSSLLGTKKFSKEESIKAIDEVFSKCYADLEPIGRRCRRNSMNMNLALIEAPMYGYNYDI